MSTRILVRKPDTLILRATMAEVLKVHQASFGMAYAKDGEITRQAGSLPDIEKSIEPSLDALEAQQVSIPLSKAIFSFSTIKWNEADKQPFVILVAPDGKNMITVFVGDGDYSKHTKGRTDHSPEYYAAMEYLKPQIYELVKAADGNPAKLVEAITEEKARELSAGLGSGSACLLIADGSCPIIRSADYMGESEEWGWISSLTPPKVVEPVKPDKPVLNLLGNSQKPTLTLALPTPAPGDTVAQLEQVSVRTGADINAERKETGNLLDRVWARPKSTAHKPKVFYERYNSLRGKSGHGYIPNNFRDRPPIEVDKKYVGQKDFDNMAEVCDAPSEADLKSSTAPAAIAAPGYQATQSVNVGMTQVTAADKNRLLEDLQWKGYTNTAGGRSADDIAKDETKRPSYYELTGLSIHDLKAHTVESMAWLVQNHSPIALATLMELLKHLPTQAASPATKQNPAQSPSGDKPKSVSSPAPGKPTLQLAI